VYFEGVDITRMPPHERARLGMAYIPQLENVFRNLTVWENLKLAGYDLPPHVFAERISRVFELFPRIKERLGQKAATLSGGERQMLAMSIGLMREPKILLFDEPTAGLSPKLAREVLESIKSLNRQGYTVILVEQNVKAALEIGDKGVLVVNGRIAFEGKASELLARRDLAKMYLGLGE
jgi:branched-chain amino acid transport system ATP-binding protein